jgi:DNA repair protein RadC
MPKRATVAYENPRTNRAEAKYFAEVRQRLDAMGAPNSGELLHTSRTYVEGAHRGGVGADVAAAVIWHQHCRTGITPDKKDCAAEECPAEAAAECPPENSVNERWQGVGKDRWTWLVQSEPHRVGYSIQITRGGYELVVWDDGGEKSYPFRFSELGVYGTIEKAKNAAKIHALDRGRVSSESVSEANDSALDASKIPACAPFTQVVKDPQKFAACQARAKQIGPLEDDRKMYEYIREELEKQDQEIFVVVGVDLHRNARSFTEIARGQRDRVQVNVEDVLRPVIENGVHGFLVAHNHPSGSANPSKKDGELTETIRAAAKVAAPNCVFLDHLVVGNGEYFSFTDRKLKKV